MVRKKEKEKIIEDMTFGKVMHKHPELAGVFLKHGMTCVGCPLAMEETIEQGAIAHGIDVKKLIKELNKKTKEKKK